jgi:hypothetical protein
VEAGAAAGEATGAAALDVEGVLVVVEWDVGPAEWHAGPPESDVVARASVAAAWDAGPPEWDVVARASVAA